MSTKDFVFFYGHSPQNEYGFASNWFPSPFAVDGKHFETMEHYMMYHKAVLMGDEDTAAEILEVRTPKQAKALGRKVNPWNERLWVENRERIVYDGCLSKFLAHKGMREKLLSTYPKRLVEASPYDRIWGIGMRANDRGVTDPKNWKGLNLLGKTLDRVRATLLNHEEQQK